MTTKELIHAELDQLSEENLSQLYVIIKGLNEPPTRAPGILSKLKRIRIDAPADFAENLDLYASGEKHVEDVH